jgi:formylglycine-generating enzyme required for sulfatase activity
LLAAWSACALVLSRSAQADQFGSGANSFEIEFVPVGQPGNPADFTGAPQPAGAVPYAYRIGRHEISEEMIDKANALGGLGITKITRGPNKPATSISWFEAARFVNWLNTSTGHTAAYKFDLAGEFQLWSPGDAGYDVNNVFRNGLAKYFLPSVNEWYKGAYYDSSTNAYFNFPTGSDSAPSSTANGIIAGTAVYQQLGPADITQAGGLSPYGTMAQGGNVAEWMETNFDIQTAQAPSTGGRGIRGGDWADRSHEMNSLATWGVAIPTAEVVSFGFRLGSVIPEPTTAAIVASPLWVLLVRSRRFVVSSYSVRFQKLNIRR